jgi:hypothetical protein
MGRNGRGISWGFAVSSTGILIIRNWYLLFGALLITCVSLFFVLSSIGSGHDPGADVFIAVLGFYSLWCLLLETLGVRISEDSVTYPVRLGTYAGVFPLFQKKIPMLDVLQASSTMERNGMRIAYLSGEFGQAKILFDTKGGRDRFFAVLNKRFPRVKIYRWT